MPNIRKELIIPDNHLWYFVGLLATDGCLSSDGRHINLTSKDADLLHRLIETLNLKTKVGIKNRGKVNEASYIEFSNKNLYEFLVSIGLTPKKSLTIGMLQVPDKWFADFLRGVIDGDGSIRNWSTQLSSHQQWSLRIYSGSAAFLRWLELSIRQIFLVTGKIYCQSHEPPRSNLSVLKYGKIAAKTILEKCYYENALALNRKATLAKDCCASSAGWSNSKVLVSSL